MMDSKSGNKVASNLRSISKNDARYWLSRVFKPRSVQFDRTYEATFYFARFQFRGRRVAMSLGTANQTEAAARAKERYLFLISNGWREFEAKYMRGEDVNDQVKRVNVTVGEFVAAVRAETELPEKTVYAYSQKLRFVVAGVMGIKSTAKRHGGEGHREWMEKINRVHLSEITPDKVIAWKKGYIAAAGSDMIARKSASISCNSYVKAAKCLFSKRRVLNKIKSLELTRTPFDGVELEPQGDMKFYGCGVNPHQILRAAVDELGPDRPEELKAFLLALVLGLRRKEADLLEWDSFNFSAGTLHVRPTVSYGLKTKDSAGLLPVEPEILALFKAWRAKAKGAFVIESNRKPKVVIYQWYRCEPVFQALLEWLREKGVQGNKPLHAMRKLYGTVLNERHGMSAASAGLRHSNIMITSKFYTDTTVKLTPGFGASLSPQPAKRRRVKRP